MLPRSVLGWPWPSIQRDSEQLRLRIEWARKAEQQRLRLIYLRDYGKVA